MKKAIACVFAVIIGVSACKAPDKTAGPADKDLSYALGIFMGTQLKGFDSPLNYDEFLKGLKDYMQEEETRMTIDEVMQKISEAYTAALERDKIANLEKERVFFEENLRRPGVMATPSGLQYEVITEGTGPKPKSADTVEVNYEGSLLDGTVFDSSYSRGQPVQFRLDQVIPGWAEGLQLMSVGSVYRLFVPSELGYGENGFRDVIPPNAALIFKVELLSIVQKGEG